MITRTNTKMAAVALLAMAALASCGDSSEGDVAQVSTPAVVATSTTPPPVKLTEDAAADPSKPVGKKEAGWAAKLCTAMVGRVSAIKPPSVDTSSPEATLASLTAFFTDVVKEQGSQLKTLQDVGPPPGNKAEKEWRKSIDELRGVQDDVSKVVSDLKGTSAANEEDVSAIIAKLGTQMKSLSSYGGPVAALFGNATIGPALKSEPACDKVS